MPGAEGQRARRLAIALAVLVLGAGALLLLRGGLESGSPGATSAPVQPQERPAVELEEPPGDPGERSPPVSTKSQERPAEISNPPTLAGLVVDDTTDAPIDSFEMLCTPAGSERNLVDTILGMESSTESASVPFTGTQGRFTIPIPDGDPQSLCAYARGYERSEPVVVNPATDLVIRLKRGGTVRGRVVDPSTGITVEGALVGWVDRQGTARTGPRERFERTDAFGRFELGSVPFSARAVLAGREDLGEGMSERLELSPEAPEREVVIELRR